MKFASILFSAIASVAAVVPTAQAQDAYPSRPIHLLVGATAGGGSDLVARIVATELTKKLGQAVVVENRPGAGGNIANLAAARAPADGYTLAMAYSGLAVNPAVMQKMPFDTLRELATVSLVADVPMGLYVNAAVPARNVKELIDTAKASPGRYALGVNALASVGHLATELFKQRTGVDMPTVVYKGSSAAMTDLLSGNVSAMFDTVASAGPQVQSGRIRMLAYGGVKRLATSPDVPTLTEAGLDNFDLRSWYGVVAPAGTPKATVDKLSTVIAEVIRMPEVVEKFEKNSLIPVGSTPDAFEQYLAAETEKWTHVAKAAKVQVQ
ncbi:Bug family tripartite tricarboxylate transporter substrate binding protein [Variovorax sp. PBL-E5]|uniref:Bug family tripartite tricarboxylate transporter substrate binding protein n=1 Tax=Variovorax sp. PBL-E5 TaxID=434014 RepID=UPI0013193C30|nr:tripartite tricarboxylate transporter substrate binding protein [Variovorax sp. PBL-E5]VTU45989.1 Argininosuccinate lyase [Variovorax sp. PBL-E5]